ncbi:MAG: CotH kinase family protein [Candidatus Marinimicrobia bacterium]|nr:CotH kinase family protein [Candidatus Neomarinimicrobiota bacterium]
MKKKILLILLFFLLPSMISAIDKPEFSHHRDFYSEPFYLTLSSDSGTIIYTLDCSKPSYNNGYIYSNPIKISRTTIVRAIACIDENHCSDVRTHSFIFLDDVIHQDNSGVPKPEHKRDHVYWTEEFDMSDVNVSEEEIKEALLDIPTISIAAPYDSLFGVAGILRGQNLMDGKSEKAGDPNDPNWHEIIECSVEMIYPENKKFGKYKDWQENAGIKIQGGGGRWYNGYYDHKQSFTLEFKKYYGEGTLKNDIFKAAPFNRETSPGEFDKIILRAGHNKSWGADWDRENTVYTRDQFGRDLQILMSGWGSHGTFVHLYLNGKYWGLYNPCERMDDNQLAIYFGGDNKDYYYGKGKDGDMAGNDDRYDYLCRTDWTKRRLSKLAEYLAIDEYIDLCLLYCYANAGDSPQYYYGNRNEPPGPVYFTAWDIEDSFGGGSKRSGPPEAIEKMKEKNRLTGDKFKLYFNVRNNIDFKMKFADRAYKHCYNNGILTDENVIAVWDSLCRFIEKAILCEIARWGDERGKVYDYDHWHKEWEDVRNDLRGRADKLIKELKSVGMYPSVQPPIFKHGDDIIMDKVIYTDSDFQLTIERAGDSDTIYYTTDGTDPRTWDLTASVSQTAIKVDSPKEIITINGSGIIKARSKKGKIWSPLHELAINPESLNGLKEDEQIENAIKSFKLYQNYPNPFNATTRIGLYLSKETHVRLEVFNLLGEKVAVLLDDVKQAGTYSIVFNGSDLPSGMYIYQLRCGNKNLYRKMLLLR